MNRLLFLTLVIFLISCRSEKLLKYTAKKQLLDDPALVNASVGICLYDPQTGNYLYNYNADKYFIPASNTKIATCYAVMKHLGDSLPGLRYQFKTADTLEILPTGDPTFMHPDFPESRVVAFIQANREKTIILEPGMIWRDNPWGEGWAWDDYEGDYMAERSPFPIYGNLVYFQKNMLLGTDIRPSYVRSNFTWENGNLNHMVIHRPLSANQFNAQLSGHVFSSQSIPFRTNEAATFSVLLADTFKIKCIIKQDSLLKSGNSLSIRTPYNLIHSQPADSMLRLMMHRSDNFFAEQSLLMVSNEMLGVMNDHQIIDTLLKTDFQDLPQKPHWVDGCGLSRYDLFTPIDMVAILNKMRINFGMERIKNIFATGNTGTLSNYYKAEEGYIFAKTGTLANVVALSGFIYTKQNKLLIFSILVNNEVAPAANVRRAIEKFIEGIREKR